MLEIRELKKVYPGRTEGVTALRGISLTVATGEFFGVVGRSGAGKSTLVRCINLLERPTSGSILVRGEEISRLKGAELRQARRRIGMVFQSFNLLWSRTAAGNVSLPLEIAGVPRDEARRRVAELLDLVGLADKADAYPSQLSGGQKQRVGIARALANQPDLLLCDEPTSALDPATTLSVLRLLKKINQELGLTVLLITHEMGAVRETCQRVAVLHEGRIAETGPVSEVFGRPKHQATIDLLEGLAGTSPSPRPEAVERSYAERLRTVGRNAL